MYKLCRERLYNAANNLWRERMLWLEKPEKTGSRLASEAEGVGSCRAIQARVCASAQNTTV